MHYINDAETHKIQILKSGITKNGAVHHVRKPWLYNWVLVYNMP